ncbi:uncharacterized protein LOC127873829 [Dreissena polymorpha]|uniref:uncharacterized protein LOC127873829 n=1 Tax=Dreissena polymorpha TaxID=45954 RepID=UPI00226502BD|nr:uncharacterized protein LOC127873829 [Dreissena polymorpha]
MGSGTSNNAAQVARQSSMPLTQGTKKKRKPTRQLLKRDKYGDVFYYDKDRDWFYYLDANGKKYFKNENGFLFYLDETDQPYVMDVNGEKIYLDENGEPVNLNSEQLPSQAELNQERRSLKNDENVPSSARGVRVSEKHLTGELYSSLRYYIHLGVRGRNGEEQKIGQATTRPEPRSPDSAIPTTSHESVQFKPSNQTPPLFEGEELGHGRIPSVEIIDHRNRPDTPTSIDSSELFEGTISPYSSLSFVSKDYNREALVTPTYLKDETDLIETQLTAQTEAENKILQKQLKIAHEKSALPRAKNFKKLGLFPVKIQEDVSDCAISGAAFLPNGQLVLADRKNQRLKLFNQELEFVTSISPDMSLLKIASWRNDYLVHVVFKNAICNGIKVYQVENNNFTHKNTMTTPWPIGAIGRSNAGIAVMQFKEDAWQIHLLDLKGKLLQEIDLKKEGYTLSQPECLFITQELNFVISDRGHNSVLCFNMHGEELFNYKQLREPLGVCSDAKDSLFISGAGLVHQISKSGERIWPLMTRETIGFIAVNISYDPVDGLLVLSGLNNSVAAFAILET